MANVAHDLLESDGLPIVPLPRDEIAERLFLGCMFAHPDRLALVPDVTDQWFMGDNAVAYRDLRARIDAGVDGWTVANAALFVTVDGEWRDYPVPIRVLARTLRAFAERRRLVVLGDWIMHAAVTDSVPEQADELLSEVRDRLTARGVR